MSHQTPFSGHLADIAALIESAVLRSAAYLVDASTSGATLDINYKADQTMVMNLDLESQRRILEGLGGQHPVVAEEDPASHSLIRTSNSYFLVDPLDGTTSCKRFLGQLGGQVGYGPLVGYVQNNRLSVAAFYSIPHRALFTAVSGQGCYASEPDLSLQLGHQVISRRRLQVKELDSLSSAGMLFFISSQREARVVEHLKVRNAVENIYRFGGFASDCVRLAQGYEQVQLQFQVKPWDFSAVLLAQEAGVDVWVDPLGDRSPLSDWRIQDNNPIVSVVPGVRTELFSYIDEVKAKNP
jgi:fructose-1,6-bisphosphatase/inositol monophosphatase family enzyme